MKEIYLKLNRGRYLAPEVTLIMLETEPGSCLCASVEKDTELEDLDWTAPDTDF